MRNAMLAILALSAASVATEDRRHDDEVALSFGRVPEHGIDRQRVADDVVAEDVLKLDRLGRRRYLIGVEPGEDLVLVEDVVELALEHPELRIGQAETGQVGDVFDIGTGQRGHGADDSRRREPRRQRLS